MHMHALAIGQLIIKVHASYYGNTIVTMESIEAL